MAENDVYNNKKRYENFKNNLTLLLEPPDKKYAKHCKYYCKNPKNLKYLKRLFEIFDAKDISYIRRNKICMIVKLILTATNKDLAEIDEKGDRDEINKIIVFMHQNYKNPNSKSDFIKDLKCIWKQLFPEKDQKGRIDETFIMLNGDNLFNVDFRKMYELHSKNKASATIALTTIEDVTAYGVAKLEGDKILEFVEKPKKEDAPSNWINSGYYILEPHVFDIVKGKRFAMMEKDVFPLLAKEGKLFGYKDEGQWFDTGTFKDYKRVKKEWLIFI